MTPEQNKRWQKAVPLLDYLDFQACSAEGLVAFEKRLKVRSGAPLWAIKARQYYITEGFQEGQPWVPDFALRSEVAMVGLKLLYLEQEARIDLYRRLLRDFLNRALAPFTLDCPMLQELRPLLSTSVPDEVLLKQLGQAIMARKVQVYRSENPVEAYLLEVAGNCVELVLSTHFKPPVSYWSQGGATLVGQFLLAHKMRINEGGYSDSPQDRIQTLGFQPVADAFLAALEAECPPPEWLNI